MQRKTRSRLAGVPFLTVLFTTSALAQIGSVVSEQEISAVAGGFAGSLVDEDHFGGALTRIGDLDGDGNDDLAVGAQFDDDGGGNQGAVWILFLEADGTVKGEQKISATSGGFGGHLDPSDNFGNELGALGDLDGDGVPDLAVGAWHDDDGANNQGAVWILFLDTDGTVKGEQKISATAGGFSGTLDPMEQFGAGVAGLGDLDGDGTPDLAVGANGDDDGGNARGAVWVLFLDTDGTVKSHQKISATAGGFGGSLDDADNLGLSLASIGDLDGDGTGELAVFAIGDDDGGDGTGAVWILFLDPDGTVTAEQKISATAGGFTGALDPGDGFGFGLASIADLDGDGRDELAVGARGDDDGGSGKGAVWILFLEADGSVRSQRKISALTGGFGGTLDVSDQLGISAASPGDLDGDGHADLAVGAWEDDGSGTNQGAVWILFLGDVDGTPPTLVHPASVAVRLPKGATEAIVTFSVTATDEVDPAPSVVCVPPSGSVFPRGVHVVTCTATDASGNVAEASFPLEVWPTLRPHADP